MMEPLLPKLLLVSEATLDKNATGLNRTLFNLLEDYPMDRFMLYAPKEGLNNNPPALPFGKHVTSFSPVISLPWRNRIKAWLSPLILRFNLQMIDLLPNVPNITKIFSFSPEIILICPDTHIALVIGYKLAHSLNVPFLVYMMDDWVAVNHQRWFTGSTQACIQRLLNDTNGLIVISSQLERILSERYAVNPIRSLVAHNPVNLTAKEPPNFKPNKQATFRIAYAGSIWGMHYDSVALIAKAVFELRKEDYNIELILHTQDQFWTMHHEFWESHEVVQGGLIPYDELYFYLQKADLLLVAASFLTQYAHMTASSIQTKITDYMAAGRPILSCGPKDGACNKFIREWKCGLVIETNDLSNVKADLLLHMRNRQENQELAKRAYQVLLNHFAKERVNQKLYQFIRESKRIQLNDIKLA